MQYIRILQHTHSDMSIPWVLSLFVFKSVVQGGSRYSRNIQCLQSSLPLLVPWIPLPSLYQAEVLEDSPLLSQTCEGTEQNRKENKGKQRYSNYFIQHTKLMHCAETSKGRHPASCCFPAVWGEGNVKRISTELPLKGKTERGLEKLEKSVHLLPNELDGLASPDGLNVRTLLWCYTTPTVHSPVYGK